MSLVFNSFCFKNRMCSGLWGTQKGRPCSWPPDSFWSKTSRNPTAIHSIQGHQSCQRGLSLRHSIHGGEIWGQMHPSSGPREWAPWGQLSSAEEAVLCEGNHEKRGLPWAWVETSLNKKGGAKMEEAWKSGRDVPIWYHDCQAASAMCDHRKLWYGLVYKAVKSRTCWRGLSIHGASINRDETGTECERKRVPVEHGFSTSSKGPPRWQIHPQQ